MYYDFVTHRNVYLRGGKLAESNIRAERARKGLTIKEVADAINVHENAVSRWESGETKPRADSLIKLSRLFGCSPEYLLGLTRARNQDLIPK